MWCCFKAARRARAAGSGGSRSASLRACAAAAVPVAGFAPRLSAAHCGAAR